MYLLSWEKVQALYKYGIYDLSDWLRQVFAIIKVMNFVVSVELIDIWNVESSFFVKSDAIVKYEWYWCFGIAAGPETAAAQTCQNEYENIQEMFLWQLRWWVWDNGQFDDDGLIFMVGWRWLHWRWFPTAVHPEQHALDHRHLHLT